MSNHDGYKTKHLKNILVRMSKCNDRLRFHDLEHETYLSYKFGEGFNDSYVIVSSQMKSKHRRYMSILTEIQDVKNDTTYKGRYLKCLENIPRFDCLEELDLKLQIMGF